MQLEHAGVFRQRQFHLSARTQSRRAADALCNLPLNALGILRFWFQKTQAHLGGGASGTLPRSVKLTIKFSLEIPLDAAECQCTLLRAC